MKRLLAIAAVLILLVGIGLFVLARRVLTGANVRAAIESQLSSAIGQPVTITGIDASVYPRVTIDLTGVAIGSPARIELASVHVGTGLRALFSRRIEGADVLVDGAKLTLPLPDLSGPGSGARAGSGGGSAVEIVSIDEIVLRNVEVVSGGRTVRGDIELVPHGASVDVRRVALAADDTTIAMTGTLTSLAPVTGSFDVKAASIDVDRLIGFLTEFAASATTAKPATTTSAPAPSPVGRVTVALAIDKATAGGLTFSTFTSTATVTPSAVTFDPLSLGVFGGTYQGSMALALGDVPRFQWRAKVSGIDAPALMAFAGAPGAITGKLSGTVSLDGEAAGLEQALRSAHGQVRVDLTDGTIAGLQLVRTLVTAGSGRGGLIASATQAMSASRTDTGGERFSRLGATLRVGNGALATDDLPMASTDVDLTASGTLRVADLSADFGGRAQLSAALSQQAGTDLYRYTQEGGRVTLPVTVTGPLRQLAVRVDVADAATRAIRNRAAEEINKAIERNLPKGLGGLFPRKPKS